jgi:hypothetical protein
MLRPVAISPALALTLPFTNQLAALIDEKLSSW